MSWLGLLLLLVASGQGVAAESKPNQYVMLEGKRVHPTSIMAQYGSPIQGSL